MPGQKQKDMYTIEAKNSQTPLNDERKTQPPPWQFTEYPSNTVSIFFYQFAFFLVSYISFLPLVVVVTFTPQWFLLCFSKVVKKGMILRLFFGDALRLYRVLYGYIPELTRRPFAILFTF